METEHEAKSISAETTFDTDLATLDDLVPVLRGLSEKVSARLKKAGVAGRTVVLKLKSADCPGASEATLEGTETPMTPLAEARATVMLLALAPAQEELVTRTVSVAVSP